MNDLTAHVIHTARLTLTPLDMTHLHTTHAYAGDLENTRLMMFLPYESVEETAQFIRESLSEWAKEAPDRCEFAILKDGAHIGGITLYFQADRSEGELGWVLHKAHWRRGYVTEAATALIVYARERWGIRRIFACCDSENAASYGVMEKLGMRRVSCLPGRKNRSSGDEERLELTCELLF